MRSLAAVVAFGALGLAACGGGGGGGGGASCSPSSSATLTFTDTGFANGSNNACVLPSGTVTFTNAGAASHTVHFDTPTSSCPTTPPQEVQIAASASSAVVFPNASVNCSFHIDNNTTTQSGTVAVSTGTVSGGGY